MDEGSVREDGLNNLKKHVFFELLNMAGRAFILVGYSDDVILGNRGFTAEEKENGIILVFNSKMNFMWDDFGITATLVFGTSPHKCFVPSNAIKAVYSSDLNAQFTVSPQPKAGGSLRAVRGQKSTTVATKAKPLLRIPRQKQERGGTKSVAKENIIEVDFTKKTKK